MANDSPLTLVGNLTADPELRFTSSGAAVANFTVASTPRRYNSQTNSWEDQEPLFMRCNVWRQMAENVTETLQKGSRVVVTGNLVGRSFTDKEGQKRSVMELNVQAIGPDLRYATATVNKVQRGGYGAPASDIPPPEDPWGSAPSSAPAQQFNDEPPF